MDVTLCLQSVFKASPKGEVSNLPATRNHTASTVLPPQSGCVVTLDAAGLSAPCKQTEQQIYCKTHHQQATCPFAIKDPKFKGITKGGTARTIHPPVVRSQARFVLSTLQMWTKGRMQTKSD